MEESNIMELTLEWPTNNVTHAANLAYQLPYMIERYKKSYPEKIIVLEFLQITIKNSF